MSALATALLGLYRSLDLATAQWQLPPPVARVYRPLDYAWDPFALYCQRFAVAPTEVLLVGMNPGPFGMVQTGIPFGAVPAVRDWMGIVAPVRPFPGAHPARPVQGFACARVEISGKRLWGWAAERFGTPENFFRRFFVLNWCPLAFVGESGKNLTPDSLPRAERLLLERLCDAALHRALQLLQPRFALGVGAFAAQCLSRCATDLPVRLGKILHPSPQSPQANRGWAPAVEAQLRDLGIALPPAAPAALRGAASPAPPAAPAGSGA